MDVDIFKIRTQITAQKVFEKKSVMLFNGTTFPTGREATFEIGDLIVTGVISAVAGDARGDSILNIHSVTTKKPFLTHIEIGDRYNTAVFIGPPPQSSLTHEHSRTGDQE
jgi:hypothetical protein